MNKNKKYFLIYVVNILLGLLYISPPDLDGGICI